MSGTAAPATLQPAIAALRERGLDPLAVLAAAGIAPEVLELPRARLRFEAVLDFWDRAADAAVDPLFGLSVAEHHGVRTNHLVGDLIAAGPDLGTDYARATEHMRVLADRFGLQFLRGGGEARLRQQRPCDHERRAFFEYVFAALVARGREVTGVAWTCRGVSFVHARPVADTAPLERFFGCPVEYDAREDALWFDEALCELPVTGADAEPSRLADDADLLARVSRLVDEDLRRAIPEVEQVARQLNLSGRSLQRRLQRLGTSFTSVLDQARRDLALELVVDAGRGLADVSFAVHFSDVAAFHRAFKRWMGVTPAQYRARLWGRR